MFCASENSPVRFLCERVLQLEVLRDLAGISVPGALTFPVVRHVEITGIDKSVLVTPIHGQRYPRITPREKILFLLDRQISLSRLKVSLRIISARVPILHSRERSTEEERKISR